ncbi:ABC-2 family transporter protein [Candidatus Gracilibacteria bacterium]|nr:ABC-2 family transporter protein [Candidatus Gracilibacteria bacterium]
MKKSLNILKFAFREQLEYRLNFILGMITMVINDFIFLSVFIIFLGYFTGTGLTFGNFLLIHSIIAFQYAIVNGIFSNIGDLPNIIEEGKLDYYLSFPLDTLKFIILSKIKVHNLGDVLFSFIAMFVYAIYFYEGIWYIFALKWLIIVSITLIFATGLFIMIGSISFWLQKGSKVRDLFQSFFLVFGSYPPTIFQSDKLLFVLISVIGLYPGVYLPYQMIVGESSLLNWIILIGSSVLMFLIGIGIFRRGLGRYSSGNLVVQM